MHQTSSSHFHFKADLHPPPFTPIHLVLAMRCDLLFIWFYFPGTRSTCGKLLLIGDAGLFLFFSPNESSCESVSVRAIPTRWVTCPLPSSHSVVFWCFAGLHKWILVEFISDLIYAFNWNCTVAWALVKPTLSSTSHPPPASFVHSRDGLHQLLFWCYVFNYIARTCEKLLLKLVRVCSFSFWKSASLHTCVSRPIMSHRASAACLTFVSRFFLFFFVFRHRVDIRNYSYVIIFLGMACFHWHFMTNSDPVWRGLRWHGTASCRLVFSMVWMQMHVNTCSVLYTLHSSACVARASSRRGRTGSDPGPLTPIILY